MTPEKHPAAENIALLRQGRELIEALEPKQYTARSPVSPGASLGEQFRHCLDFYTCLIDGLASGSIDYDRRQRSPEIETSIDRASALSREIGDRLEALDPGDLDLPLDVRGDAEEGDPWSKSSLRRELTFLVSHTVHHYALIAMILRDLGVRVPSELGVASSTLRHWERSSSRLA